MNRQLQGSVTLELSGDSLQLTYTTMDDDGQPSLQYDDGQRQLSFSGDQVQVEHANLGMLVTVRTMLTVDTGSTTLTLLVPDVVMNGYDGDIETLAIVTQYRTPLSNPGQPGGPLNLYQAIPLSGTARTVNL